MARFGPRADGPPIFGPGQAGPIYKRRTGPKWADGPSQAPEKPARAGPKRAGPRPDTSLPQMHKCLKNWIRLWVSPGRFSPDSSVRLKCPGLN